VGGQCEAPCGPGERLQRAYCRTPTENGVGEVGSKEEGVGRKKRGPACVQHRAHSLWPGLGWLGFGQRSRVEWAWCTHGLG
jgi:hypothetical protein